MSSFDWAAEVKDLLAISKWPWKSHPREQRSDETIITDAEGWSTARITGSEADDDFIASSPTQRARMVVERVKVAALHYGKLINIDEKMDAYELLGIDPADYAELVRRLEESE